jgi:rhodanese-related sulfurtransferase
MKNTLFLAIMTLFVACSEPTIAQNKLNADAFEKLITTDKNVQLIDVRTPQEIANGFIKDAQHINIADADFQTRMGKLDKNKPVAVYCAAGGRSGRAAKMLTDMGFTKVYDLAGGMGAWQGQNKPIVKK